jgi:hypothetical protein
VPVCWKIPFSPKVASKQLSSDRQAVHKQDIRASEAYSVEVPQWLTTRPPGPGIFPPSKKEGVMKVKSPWSLVNVYVAAANAGPANRRLAKQQ